MLKETEPDDRVERILDIIDGFIAKLPEKEQKVAPQRFVRSLADGAGDVQ